MCLALCLAVCVCLSLFVCPPLSLSLSLYLYLFVFASVYCCLYFNSIILFLVLSFFFIALLCINNFLYYNDCLFLCFSSVGSSACFSFSSSVCFYSKFCSFLCLLFMVVPLFIIFLFYSFCHYVSFLSIIMCLFSSLSLCHYVYLTAIIFLPLSFIYLSLSYFPSPYSLYFYVPIIMFPFLLVSTVSSPSTVNHPIVRS